MAIQPTSSSTQTGLVGSTKTRADQSSTKTTETATNFSDSSAAVFEKSEDTTSSNKLSYSMKLSELSRQAEEKYANLRSIVENLFNKQTVKQGKSQGLSYDEILSKYDGNLKSFYQNLEVDDSTRLEAQQSISEDGFYGVKQTSDRIAQFAISLSGGDPSKLAELKAAIEKGYAEAEKSWGGELPGICNQTKEAALKKIDDWASSQS